MQRIVGILAALILVLQLQAQHQDASWSARRAVIDKPCIEGDSLCNVLRKYGTFEGHLRSFVMSTINYQDYPDYYAWGIGGGLGYFSPVIKNFQVGMSGFVIYNLSSSHLAPAAPFSNRYELGLFDVSNPDNHEDLDRLEDLYLRYYFSRENHSYLQFGKFHLKTPLINLQDGRMRPNLQEGIWGEWIEWQKIKLKGGWLWRTSPRSTIHWFDIGKSVGVYPMGRAVDGQRAQYAGHVKTEGIAITNVTYTPAKQINIHGWNYYAPALLNTSLLKAEVKQTHHQTQWLVGFQYLFQKSLYNDTLSVHKQYTSKGEQAHVFSTRLARTYVPRNNEWSLNYTRITAHGRFLFPREWGVESFYTFMNRERVEGAGDVHAVMVQNKRPVMHKNLSLQTQAGLFFMPAIDRAELNKYTMPDFYHVNARMQYSFSDFLKGLQLDVLYSYKGILDHAVTESPENFHNKVNAHLVSLVVDYYF